MSVFETLPGFCPDCGSIFPQLLSKGNIACYKCKTDFHPEALGGMDVEFTLHFNSYTPQNKKSKVEETEDGPVVERKCSKCGYEKMTYATVQLRSADEGQTVFFTCIKCKYKESENS